MVQATITGTESVNTTKKLKLKQMEKLMTRRASITHPKKQECTYCGITTEGAATMVYRGCLYHQACGNAVKNRKENPGLFRTLDDIRKNIEQLYDKEDLVVESSGQIMAISSILTGIKKT